jgi:hypothetical protein
MSHTVGNSTTQNKNIHQPAIAAPCTRSARYQTAIPAAFNDAFELVVPLEQASEHSSAAGGVPELALVADETTRWDCKHKTNAVLSAHWLHLNKLCLALTKSVHDDAAVFLHTSQGAVVLR